MTVVEAGNNILEAVFARLCLFNKIKKGLKTPEKINPYYASDKTWYKKVNGSWVSQGTVAKVYKKVSGSWVEQSDISSAIDSNTKYIIIQS